MKHKKHIPEGSSSSSVQTIFAVAQTVLLLILVFQVSSLDSIAAPSANTGNAAGNAPTAVAPSAPSAPTAPAAAIDMSGFEGHTKGDEDAPVTIVEWSDFECPFCARFYSQTLSQLESEYIETGKVKIIYKHFPLSFHPNAQKAAEATECAADQGQFWEMHDAIFEQGASGGVASFKAIAGQLGLNQADFDDCLDSGKYAADVQADMAEGAQNGITGTPGFLVGGQRVSGAQPFAVFQQAIEAALAEQ